MIYLEKISLSMKRNTGAILIIVFMLFAILAIVFWKYSGGDDNPVVVDSMDELLPSGSSGQVIRHRYYTLSYREKYEQAEWVFYRLTASQVRNKHHYSRPFFVRDPLVKTKSAAYYSYKNSGYDKGHLCPAGDRSFNRDAFNETFYTSNISPQSHDFNSGIWNRLEQRIRRWALRYGELYVVTGGVLKPELKSIGKEKVAVPEYFYKIVFNPGRSTALTFLIPNSPSDRSLRYYLTNVDSIEKVTGIDFFAHLPDSIQNQFESRSDYKKWLF